MNSSIRLGIDIGAFVVSFVCALVLTPVMRHAAMQIGLVDRPDGKLKTHENVTPYLGGLAVYLAFLLTVGVFTDFGSAEVLGLLLSGSIILIVGLIDDFGALSPSQKLLGQTLAALVLVRSGTYIKLQFLPWYLAVPLTVFWILAVSNAVNIIDILDGLASGVAVVAALLVAAANTMAGRDPQALFSVILAGSALGFLRHNFYPARIYLGDTGSLFIGFMLASLTLNAGYTRMNHLALLTPILILGVPLFDLAFVMWTRWRMGLPVMKGSPDHFALRLRRCKLTVRETAITAYIIAALFGGVGLLMSQVTLQWAIATMGGVVSMAVLMGYLLLKVDMRS
ncbi:MAG TPA: MraY family glycosyltransferase [Terriglobia bacterium]|nr:MraY family glycosyltransferase [Terriglobia bacterium]